MNHEHHRHGHQGSGSKVGEHKCGEGRCGHAMKHDPAPQPAATTKTGTKYTCPMHPEIVRDGPGNCPICGMALEPVTPAADEGENEELKDMTRRFWISAALTLPLLWALVG